LPVPVPLASLSQPRSTSAVPQSAASHLVSPPSPAADSNSKSHVAGNVKAHPAVPLEDGPAALLPSVAVTDTPPRSPNVLPTPDSQLHDAPNGASCSSNGAPSSEEGPSVHEDDLSAATSPEDERLRIDSAISNPPDDDDESFEKSGLKSSLPNKERYDESTNHAPSHSVDAVSSPSSTTGAYSTSTPKPVHHSPDTSPEADSSRSAEELARTINDAHQVLEDVTMKDAGASGGALVNGTSPNYQLRLEEAQANVAATRPVDDGQASAATPKLDQEMSDLDGSDARKETPNKLMGPPNGDATSSHATPATNPPSAMFKDVEMTDAPHVKTRPASISTNAGETVPSSTPSRMTTRVASGAIRQKSVSEILGEVSKTSPVLNMSPSMRRHSVNNEQDSSEKHHRRRSTVVFSRDKDPASAKAYATDLDGYLALKGASLDQEKDYLRPLFLHQAWAPPRSRTLSDLISTASKTLTTSDICAVNRELVEIKILRRIYQLQNANKWSLRQMAKYNDPTPPPCHQDFLLREMRWMRTDFREERKWKLQLARNLARWCAEYVAAPEGVRRTLRVQTSSLPVHDTDVMAESFDGLAEDDILETIAPNNPPTNLFSLDYDEVVFQISHTPHGTALLGELPLYDPKSDARSTDSSLPLPSRNTLVPVSKYVTGKLVPKIDSPPRKRSRFDFEQSDEDTGPPRKRTNSSQSSPFLSPARRSSPRTEIPPEDQEVALFNPINKHILDRIRANHAFRPPTEFNMPAPAFYETRLQSQWTWDEDQRLRHCVRKYSYNWSLIAQDLADQTQSSQFMPAPERRTPWECFERWMQLEGLPNDMSRTAYFKTYQSRIEQANLKISQAAANAQAQPGTAQSPTQTHTIKRRTSSQPIKVERRKDVKHIGMVDAIRRVARKRENILHRAHESM
jgi:chromatin modification-related protein VID21